MTDNEFEMELREAVIEYVDELNAPLPERPPLTLVKGKHCFVFHWNEETIDALGEQLFELVMNPHVPFDGFDMGLMKYQMDRILNADLE